MVAVLGVPCRGRGTTTFTNPTFMTRRRRASASRWQPTGTWGKVTLSERPTPRKREEPLTRLQAAEERLNGHVHADRDVLQHLRLHPGQRGPFRLERRQQRVLVVEPHGLLALFPTPSCVLRAGDYRASGTRQAVALEDDAPRSSGTAATCTSYAWLSHSVRAHKERGHSSPGSRPGAFWPVL